MVRNVLRLALGIILTIASALSQSVPDSSVPADSEIRKILAERIDAQRQSLGIVVGVIEAKGRRIIAYGALDKDDKRPLNVTRSLRSAP